MAFITKPILGQRPVRSIKPGAEFVNLRKELLFLVWLAEVVSQRTRLVTIRKRGYLYILLGVFFTGFLKHQPQGVFFSPLGGLGPPFPWLSLPDFSPGGNKEAVVQADWLGSVFPGWRDAAKRR